MTHHFIPAGWRVYSIGDIHGRADLLAQLYRNVCKDRERRPCRNSVIVTLGDYIDRGAGSREVIDSLIEIADRDFLVPLRGNHDTWLLDFLEAPETAARWFQLGGSATLQSYGVAVSSTLSPDILREAAAKFRAIFPPSHSAFFKNLAVHFTFGDYFFVHAGVRPGVSLELQQEEDCYWIRNEFLDFTDRFEKFIVHGHTPGIQPELRPNRMNVDTGAYATGRLTAAVLEEDTVFFLSSND